MLLISHRSKKFRISTRISVAPGQWNAKTQKIVNHPHASTLNIILRRLVSQAEFTALTLSASPGFASMDCEKIRDTIRAAIFPAEADQQEKPTKPAPKDYLCQRFESFTELHRGKTAQGYKGTARKLEEYLEDKWPKFRICSIDRKWLQAFDLWLQEKCGLACNSRSVHLRNLRAVVYDAVADNVCECMAFQRFTIKTEKTAKRSLSLDQLRTLFSYPGEEYSRRYVDAFKLMFMLCGINIIDLCHLEKIVDGRIVYHRAKTGRLYSIKVEPEAMEIINRYKGETHLLNYMDTNKDHATFAKRMNDALGRLGKWTWPNGKKSSPEHNALFPELTTYWARHTWATIASSLNIPKETIAAALGHGASTVTDIYIDYERNKVDRANRAVLDWVLYGKLPAIGAYYGEGVLSNMPIAPQVQAASTATNPA